MAKNAVYINDSIHGLIRLSDYEKCIISSIGFNRLHDVYQNSTVYLTYPTNRTKRFEHSIGTMKLCTDMFYHSISNVRDHTPDGKKDTTLKDFLKKAKGEIKNVVDSLRKIGSTRYDQYIEEIPRSTEDFWNNVDISVISDTLIPHNISKDDEKTYAILMQSVRVAALLHDIGHPPYSHVVEEAIMEIYKEIKSENKKKQKHTEFYKTIDSCVSGDVNAHLHEKIGVILSESILYDVIKEDKNNQGKVLFDIIVKECVNRIFNESSDFFAGIHRIIDSDLDGDRLDYVTRDTLNSGISCGSIDYSRLILDMKLKMCDGVPFFCVPVKAINTVEDVFQRRFNLYKNVVFHHRAKKTDYLLKDVVYRLLKDRIEDDCKPKGKERDEKNAPNLLSIAGLWCPLLGGTTAQINTDLSQWNDSWLMTFLKSEYYDKYYKTEFDPDINKSDYVLKKEMSELLRNEKHFYSMIKRSEDHNIIDSNMHKTIISELGKKRIDEYIKTLDSMSEAKKESHKECSNTNGKATKKNNQRVKDNKKADGATSAIMIIDGMKSYLNQIIDDSNAHSQLWLAFEKGESLDVTGDANWASIVRECVEEACQEQYKESYITSILVFNKFKIGVTGDVRFYDANNQLHKITDVSNIQEVIKYEYRFLPKIHLYVLTKDNKANIKKEALLENIGCKLGLKAVELIQKNYNELLNNNSTKVSKEEQVAST